MFVNIRSHYSHVSTIDDANHVWKLSEAMELDLILANLLKIRPCDEAVESFVKGRVHIHNSTMNRRLTDVKTFADIHLERPCSIITQGRSSLFITRQCI